MCGGGGSSAPVDTYVGPSGPGTNIGNVPLGEPNYQQQAQSLLSLGQTYGQMASGIASQLQQQPPMAPPPAPQSAFDGGIGQYIASQAARPMGPSPAMQELTAMEAGYDPRSSAIEMLQNYQGTEAQPLSFYTPESIDAMERFAEEEAAREAAEAVRQREARGGREARGIGAPMDAMSRDVRGGRDSAGVGDTFGGSPDPGFGGFGGFGGRSDGIGSGGLY